MEVSIKIVVLIALALVVAAPFFLSTRGVKRKDLTHGDSGYDPTYTASDNTHGSSHSHDSGHSGGGDFGDSH
jgi:hypothetical protein